MAKQKARVHHTTRSHRARQIAQNRKLFILFIFFCHLNDTITLFTCLLSRYNEFFFRKSLKELCSSHGCLDYCKVWTKSTRAFWSSTQILCQRIRGRDLVKWDNSIFLIVYSKLLRRCGSDVSVIIWVRYGVCTSLVTKSFISKKSFRWITSFPSQCRQ